MTEDGQHPQELRGGGSRNRRGDQAIDRARLAGRPRGDRPSRRRRPRPRARVGSIPPGEWLRSQLEGTGGGSAPRSGAATQSSEDFLRDAEPHPLDVPTAQQGTALAALDSGRWTLKPGTRRASVRGGGPGPRDALGLVRELQGARLDRRGRRRDGRRTPRARALAGNGCAALSAERACRPPLSPEPAATHIAAITSITANTEPQARSGTRLPTLCRRPVADVLPVVTTPSRPEPLQDFRGGFPGLRDS